MQDFGYIAVLLVVAVFGAPIIGIIIYLFIQSKKKISPVKIECVDKSVGQEVKTIFSRVNGWLKLVDFYMSLYFVFNVWAMGFSLLTFLIVFYDETQDQTVIISLCAALALIATSLNFIIRPQKMFSIMNPKWIEARFLAIEFKMDIAKNGINDIEEKIVEINKKLDRLSNSTEYI